MTEPREHIVVRVAPDGTIAAETKGIKGSRCLDYINVLEGLLDAQTTNSAFTPEYHQSATSSHYEESNDLQQW